MENTTPPVQEEAVVEAQRLTVGQRLGNLVSASVESGIALWALSGEVNPSTPSEYVRDIACSAIAYWAVRGAVKDTYGSATGTGKPAITFTRGNNHESATDQTDS